MRQLVVPVSSLTRSSFRSFGDVVETDGAEHYETNAGYAERFHNLAKIDCTAQGGRPLLSIFRTKPFPMPLRVELMERHPISSQAFVPMGSVAFLVVVAERTKQPEPTDLRAFLTNGHQGINYDPGTWHHPLISFGAADFLVIDRKGPGEGHDQDYEEVRFEDCEIIVSLPTA